MDINLTEIIFAIANFLILTGVLAKFLYKPFLAMLENRKLSIKEAFDNAEAVNRRADEKMESYNKRIASVEQEGREIIKNAKIKAEAQAKDIVDGANVKASEMLLAAEREIERERIRAIAEMKTQIGTLALLAAEKILEKDIEIEGQDQIIDTIIEQAGNAEWLN